MFTEWPSMTEKGIGRVRDVVNGPDAYLYIVLNQPDRIERIAPAQ